MGVGGVAGRRKEGVDLAAARFLVQVLVVLKQANGCACQLLLVKPKKVSCCLSFVALLFFFFRAVVSTHDPPPLLSVTHARF